MRTKSRPKINVVTLGCSKNIYDSEILMGQLNANNFLVTHEKENNDGGIVIINTCGFIDNAKQESIDTILKFAREKKEGKIEQLYVTGCLSERYKPELKKDIPEVDEYFGTKDLIPLLKTLGADYKHELIGERLLTTPSHYAYLKISEGCDRPCSFCAIPLMRGKHISISKESLIAQAKLLAAKGVKELILIAQDLTYYGLDIYGSRKLSELLNQLCDVDGIEWIRLHYAYPSGFPMEILDVMNTQKKICNYLDIPLQHISDNMLKSMRRGITKEKTIRLVHTIREKIPDIAIRTTLIAGYPGETDKDFDELKEFVSETKFDRLGIFTYSHEENTHAFNLQDDVPADIKQQRAEDIMSMQQRISEELNQVKIGKNLNVLFDRKDGEYFIGRTEHDSPEVDNEVLVDAKNNYVRFGDFSEVEITDAGEFDLFGKIIA